MKSRGKKRANQGSLSKRSPATFIPRKNKEINQTTSATKPEKRKHNKWGEGGRGPKAWRRGGQSIPLPTVPKSSWKAEFGREELLIHKKKNKKLNKSKIFYFPDTRDGGRK